jgi:hypothetical protein
MAASPATASNPATRATPFRIIPDSAYWALWRILHNAHLLRDLKGLSDFEPGNQERASQMASLLVEARGAASATRQAGQSALHAAVLDDLVTRYRELAAAGQARAQGARLSEGGGVDADLAA